MSKQLSRRNFLHLGGLALGSLAFRRFYPLQSAHSPGVLNDIFVPVFGRQGEYAQGEIARITIQEIDLRSEPRDDSPIIGKRYRDQIVHIYEEVESEHGPSYNPIWYRVWGGYLHSAYLQKVKVNLNPPLQAIGDGGQLCEVSVPYTIAYQHNSWQGWHPWNGTPLYFQTTHWITSLDEGPDGRPWYELTSEIDANLKYFVPTEHLRPIRDEEISPLSPQVPPEQKRIEISISRQTLVAYENGEAVLTTRISSGIPSRQRSANDLPTATPRGRFRIYSKLPNKHMGQVTGNPDAEGGFSLPGVPWTCFFAQGGYALHGTYWHNNFGIQMSHGCVNLRNEDALWLFRWTTPEFKTPIETHADWERRGNGTQVIVE